ncbi:hypothetical protein L1049_008063 [Liquidambar formosana]|uniref:CCHC-type domain-containing protein n=1 Tax=Liquidambar formosana TaxID=63359 RepID=A0AAP0S3Q6_LIQFO
MSDATINRKILRSLPIRFLPKITSIEDNRDLDTMKKEDLVGEIQNYEMKFCKPKKEPKNIGIALSTMNEKSSRHVSRTGSDFDISEEEIAYFVKKFNKFFRILEVVFLILEIVMVLALVGTMDLTLAKSRTHGEKPNDMNDERDKIQCYECHGFGHIAPECANTKKKQSSGQNNEKGYNATLSDSETESDSEDSSQGEEDNSNFMAFTSIHQLNDKISSSVIDSES